jgi:[acyl-carrier-protein] S-malonyltransferase
MAEAAAAMERILAEVPFANPSARLLANADARAIETADGARAELVEHLTAGVDWVRAVETMAAAGVDTFVEVGPGKVLTNLIKRIAPAANALALEDALAGDALDLPILL